MKQKLLACGHFKTGELTTFRAYGKDNEGKEVCHDCYGKQQRIELKFLQDRKPYRHDRDVIGRFI